MFWTRRSAPGEGEEGNTRSERVRLRVIAHDSERASDLSDLIRATKRGVESVIIAGGDGTLQRRRPGAEPISSVMADAAPGH